MDNTSNMFSYEHPHSRCGHTPLYGFQREVALQPADKTCCSNCVGFKASNNLHIYNQPHSESV